MTEEYNFTGNMVGCDVYGYCPHDLQECEAVIRDVIISLEVGQLESCYHQFEPHGITYVQIISESHIAIHTYPEHNACFVDVFTCGSRTKEQISEALWTTFNSRKATLVKMHSMSRGFQNLPTPS